MATELPVRECSTSKKCLGQESGTSLPAATRCASRREVGQGDELALEPMGKDDLARAQRAHLAVRAGKAGVWGFRIDHQYFPPWAAVASGRSASSPLWTILTPA